jgi:hypothetical protein
MPEDTPLKVEVWPIERVIAYASNPRKRSAAAVDKLAASVPVALWPSASRRRQAPVQQFLRPHRSGGPVRLIAPFATTSEHGPTPQSCSTQSLRARPGQHRPRVE